ncbi:S4 domain-containing protein [Altererythrobacter sp. GH1-8]|uniref:S4 domain-containing protein n=1 Tax=Altererythrobacter sp. GH1-8 TaxID=3349333 RepID=UPI00374D55E0
MTGSLRLDKFLVYCRFARTRSRAQAMIDQGLMRVNGTRALRGHAPVAAGDTLTLVHGGEVMIVAIESLPERREPPAKAKTRYRMLDRAG